MATRVVRKRPPATLTLALILSGCFAPPDYRGRRCSEPEECGGLACVEGLCASPRAGTEAPDGGLPALGPNEVVPRPSTFDAGPRPAPPSAPTYEIDAGTGAAADSGSTSPRSCSLESATPISLKVVNHCTFPIDVAWLDSTCAEQVLGTIPAGGISAIDTFVSHEFVMKGEFTGREYRQVLPPASGPGDVITCRALIHRYSFDGDVRDSALGADGTRTGGTYFVDGVLYMDGVDGHVSLPIGDTLALIESVTIEAWFGVFSTPSPQPWARVFDFGAGTDRYFMFAPINHVGGSRFTSKASGEAESNLETAAPSLDQLHHLAITVDANQDIATLYLDGVARAQARGVATPHRLGATVDHWLGRSNYPQDPFFHGGIDEFRIYFDALSAEEIAQNIQLGPNVTPF